MPGANSSEFFHVESLLQVDFMSIMTFSVSHTACSASILNHLKGMKIALECRTFEPEAAHYIMFGRL